MASFSPEEFFGKPNHRASIKAACLFVCSKFKEMYVLERFGGFCVDCVTSSRNNNTQHRDVGLRLF